MCSDATCTLTAATQPALDVKQSDTPVALLGNDRFGVDTGLFHVALRVPMRTSSAVKPDSSITADNHFHTARNSLKLRDSIGPPYREFFDEEKIHSVQVVVSRIAACGADEKCTRIFSGTVAAALTVIETFKGDAWAATKRLEGFFADAERRAQDLPDDQRERTIERLRKARGLVGSTDALERFDAWRAPEER